MSHLKMRDLRLKRGLTVDEVGKMTYYSYGTIARAERGTLYKGTRSNVKRELFWQAMSEFYKVPVEKLKEVGNDD